MTRSNKFGREAVEQSKYAHLAQRSVVAPESFMDYSRQLVGKITDAASARTLNLRDKAALLKFIDDFMIPLVGGHPNNNVFEDDIYEIIFLMVSVEIARRNKMRALYSQEQLFAYFESIH